MCLFLFKLEKWPAVVEVVKNELNALKSFVCAQEQRLVSALQETKLTEKQLQEVSCIILVNESNVKPSCTFNIFVLYIGDINFNKILDLDSLYLHLTH